MKDKGRDMPEKGNDATGSVVKPEDAAPSTASGRSSVVEDSIPNRSGGQPGHVNGGSTSAESSTTLLSEATVLLKSLKPLKAMKLKPINADAATSCRPMGLFDGGATHGLRMAYASDINHLEQVEVELASGTAFLYRYPAHKTLLSKTPIEPIVPLHRLVQMGYKIEWSASGCRIFHPSLGVIQCYLRNGCPVMDRDGPLEILKEMERLDSGGVDLQADELRWWKECFPLVPDGVLKRFRGQGEEWGPDLLPWNRRQRRAHARRAVAIHLFSGFDTKKWIRPEVGDWEWLDLH